MIKKTALIFAGVVHRSLPYTISSIRENLFGPLLRHGELDIFYHSWDISNINNPRAGEINVRIETGLAKELLPEAKGIFESQELFDASINWRIFLRNNPYKSKSIKNKLKHIFYKSISEDITIKNFIRYLESKKRAWDFFEKNSKNTEYDYIISARADMLYHKPFNVPNIEPQTIYVPEFHSWEGINDRFAIGEKSTMAHWFDEIDFAKDWIYMNKRGSSEMILEEWLSSQKVGVEKIDFSFKRIRGDGQVFFRDLDV